MIRTVAVAALVCLAAGLALAQDDPPPWLEMTVVQVDPARVDEFLAAQRELSALEQEGGTAWRSVSRTAIFGDTYRFIITTPLQSFARLDRAGNDDAARAAIISRIRNVITSRQSYAVRTTPSLDNPLPDLDRPEGVPAAYADHARLLFDLQVLALQADVTRVITFQLARESSNRTYPEIGVPDPHHATSHHGGDPEKIAKIAKINQFHVSLFATFLEKLASVEDGQGSLLDHSLYLYGSGMGNPNIHDHVNLPIVVAGGGAGKAKGGRYIKYAEPKPLANLHLTLLDSVGVHF